MLNNKIEKKLDLILDKKFDLKLKSHKEGKEDLTKSLFEAFATLKESMEDLKTVMSAREQELLKVEDHMKQSVQMMMKQLLIVEEKVNKDLENIIKRSIKKHNFDIIIVATRELNAELRKEVNSTLNKNMEKTNNVIMDFTTQASDKYNRLYTTVKEIASDLNVKYEDIRRQLNHEESSLDIIGKEIKRLRSTSDENKETHKELGIGDDNDYETGKEVAVEVDEELLNFEEKMNGMNTLVAINPKGEMMLTQYKIGWVFKKDYEMLANQRNGGKLEY
jgi:uncharacterized protein YukE